MPNLECPHFVESGCLIWQNSGSQIWQNLVPRILRNSTHWALKHTPVLVSGFAWNAKGRSLSTKHGRQRVWWSGRMLLCSSFWCSEIFRGWQPRLRYVWLYSFQVRLGVKLRSFRLISESIRQRKSRFARTKSRFARTKGRFAGTNKIQVNQVCFVGLT